MGSLLDIFSIWFIIVESTQQSTEVNTMSNPPSFRFRLSPNRDLENMMTDRSITIKSKSKKINYSEIDGRRNKSTQYIIFILQNSNTIYLSN